jgi:hypothetical protein
MPSPFPGMDPWLEAPDIWPDFHERLANEISTGLNQSLPLPYYARLEMRPEVGLLDLDEGTGYTRKIVPDVSVVDPSRKATSGAVAVLDAPRTEFSESVEVSVSTDELGRHVYVEIRDSRRGHRLITLIEIVSPANKRPGPDREAYLKKHREVYQSDASLIELDLLRSGERLSDNLHLVRAIEDLQPSPDYLVLVNRAWLRTGQVSWQIFPIGMRDMLPCIPVPLREDEPEVPLDLQYVFNRAYDSGPYRRGAIDYTQPSVPPLSDDDAAWAHRALHEQGLLTA